jgi:choice-of-anchor A domain-containing protein
LGDSSATAVINVPGENIMLEAQNIILDGKIRPSNITWNFYQAKFLHLSHTHNAKLGMPGIVMAPKAVVEFNEALITGALYAGDIVTSLTPYSVLNAGQVNVDPTNPATPVPPPPAPAPKPY